MEINDTLRDLVAALTTIRPGSDNESNAVAFLYDNAVRFHRHPSIDSEGAAAELRGLVTKLLTHGHTAAARRLTELTHALHESAGGAAAARASRLLLDLAGNPLRVDDSVPPPSAVPLSPSRSPSYAGTADDAAAAAAQSAAAASISDWRAECDDESDDGGSTSSDSDVDSLDADGGARMPAYAGAAAAGGLAPRQLLPVSTARDAGAAPSAPPPVAPPALAALLQPTPAAAAPAPAPLHTVLQTAAAAAVPAATAAVAAAASRCWPEDAYVSAALAALQGAAGPSALTPGDAPFVASPYVVPPAAVATASWDALPLLPPPYAQLEQLLTPVAAAAPVGGTGGTARFVAALRHAVWVDACVTGAPFVPLIINDASGHAGAAAAAGAPVAATTARLTPLDCPGLGPQPLRSQLVYVATVANQARWVRWMCDAVTRTALAGGDGGGVARALAAATGDGAPAPAVPTGLLRFGPVAAQLAAGLRQLVDDFSLDAACVQAALHDRRLQLQRGRQHDDDSRGRPAVFSAEAVLAAEAMPAQPAGAGAKIFDRVDDDGAHPRLTLTGLVAWLRRYAPLLQLAVSLCRACLLRAPDAGTVAPAVFVALGRCSGTSGSDDASAALAQRHSTSARLFHALFAASDAVFPAWVAATCVDALADALQMHASSSPPGAGGGSGAAVPSPPLARRAGSGGRLLTVPLSHLPEPPASATAVLSLLLTALRPYLRALDAFAMGADAPPASLELPFSAADAAATAAACLLQWARACIAMASAGGRASDLHIDDATHRGVPQRLLFDGTDGSQGTGVVRAGDADDDDWARLGRAVDDAHAAACALDTPLAGLLPLSPLAPAFLRAAVDARTAGAPTSSAGAAAPPSSVAALVLQTRTYRAVLTAVDHAAEGRGDGAGVLLPGGLPGGDHGDDDGGGNASPWGFGTLLFAPLETSFRARLAATLAPATVAVTDGGGDNDGSGAAIDPAVEPLDSSHDVDADDNGSSTGSGSQRAVDDGVRSSDGLHLPAIALSDLNDLDGGSAVGGDSDAATASYMATGTNATRSQLTPSAAVSAAGSVAPSLPSTARSAGAPATVSATFVRTTSGGGHDATSVTAVSTRPVFQPGYVVPRPGTKRSAWWDIDAQVDVKKQQQAEEEAAAAAAAERAGTAHSDSAHEDDDGGASDAVSAIADVPSSATAVITSDALSVATAAGRPPRPGARGAGARQWGPLPHHHPHHGDMSAILEETAETSDGDDDSGSDGDGGGGSGMSGSELDVVPGRPHDGVDATATAGTTGAAVDGAADVASFVVVVGSVGRRGPPAGGVRSAQPAVAVVASAPAPATAALPDARHSASASDDWLLPEHVWAADGPMPSLPPFGSRSEWDAVATLLYPQQLQPSAATTSGVASGAGWTIDGPPPPSDMVPSAWTADLRCERVASVLRRDLVGVLSTQHRLLTRAVTWALLQRLQLLPRHLWGLRAVCLLEQPHALAGFTGPLFDALEAARARGGGGSAGALAVRDSYRLTAWLRSALASGLPPAHLSHGVVGDGGGGEGPRPHPHLHPSDFSITFTGYAAATDGELLSTGLALAYEPARHFPLSLVLDAPAMGTYRALFGHVLALAHADASVAAATRRAALAARQLHAALGPPLPPDAAWVAGMRAGAHEAHLLLSGLGHFTRSLRGHTAHALLMAPWDELTAALARLADGGNDGGDDGGGDGAGADTGGGLPAIRAAHNTYLATLRRLCLLGGDGQRAAAAAQRVLLQRACDGAALVDGWFASAVAAATAARRAAGVGDAAAGGSSDARALRRLPLVDDAAAAAAGALGEPLRARPAISAAAAAFSAQLGLVVRAALGGGASSGGGHHLALADLATLLDHSGYYSGGHA